MCSVDSLVVGNFGETRERDGEGMETFRFGLLLLCGAGVCVVKQLGSNL